MPPTDREQTYGDLDPEVEPLEPLCDGTGACRNLDGTAGNARDSAPSRKGYADDVPRQRDDCNPADETADTLPSAEDQIGGEDIGAETRPNPEGRRAYWRSSQNPDNDADARSVGETGHGRPDAHDPYRDTARARFPRFTAFLSGMSSTWDLWGAGIPPDRESDLPPCRYNDELVCDCDEDSPCQWSPEREARSRAANLAAVRESGFKTSREVPAGSLREGERIYVTGHLTTVTSCERTAPDRVRICTDSGEDWYSPTLALIRIHGEDWEKRSRPSQQTPVDREGNPDVSVPLGKTVRRRRRQPDFEAKAMHKGCEHCPANRDAGYREGYADGLRMPAPASESPQPYKHEARKHIAQIRERLRQVEAERDALNERIAFTVQKYEHEAKILEYERDALRAALERFVTFHSGHLLGPELASIQTEAREALDNA